MEVKISFFNLHSIYGTEYGSGAGTGKGLFNQYHHRNLSRRRIISKPAWNPLRLQPVQNIEILVVDGGSTDQTVSILNEFIHPGLSWISEPDQGIYDALNKGIQKARGRWFYFLGSDDLLLPGFSDMAEKLRSRIRYIMVFPKATICKAKKTGFHFAEREIQRI